MSKRALFFYSHVFSVYVGTMGSQHTGAKLCLVLKIHHPLCPHNILKDENIK